MMSSRLLKGLTVAIAAGLVAGCASRAPAPVVDRAPPPAAKPVPAPAAPARPETYTVKRGDTLYSIAREQGVDVGELAALNGLSDPTRISVGQVLRLRRSEAVAATPEAGVQVRPITGGGPIEARPIGADTGRVETIGGPAPLAGSPAGSVKTAPRAEKLPYSEENVALLQRRDQMPSSAAAPAPAPAQAAPAPATKPEAQPAQKPETRASDTEDGPDRVDWSWPAGGKVAAGFNESTNKGITIAGKIGDPVYASAGGRVIYVGNALRGYGNLVIVKHNDTFLSVYAHNRQILVKQDQNVTKGQKIAEVGGADDGSGRLHFEIRRQGKPVDPLRYLPERR